MEDYRIIKLSIYVLLGGTLFVLPLFSFAYSRETTHAALAQETVKFFNHSFPELKINDEKMELVIRGDIEEDNAPRWMRHFYDPVYNRGLIFGVQWMSSKNWSQDTLAQAGINHRMMAGTLKSYFGAEDDYSWERAIYEYAWGSKDRGLESLGHVLHLLQDATVPDHTRNDPHPPVLDMGSPYEGWAVRFTRNNFHIFDQIKNKQPLLLSNINNYFDTIATYSNGNFFSKDTILYKEYSNPKILAETSEKIDGKNYTFGLQTDENKEKYRLVKITKRFGDKKIEYSLESPKDLILTDYWTRLSKMAVTHGAGAMKLFFDEVAREKETKVLYEKNRSWLMKKLDAFTLGAFRAADLFYGISVEPKDVSGGNQGANIAEALNNPETLPPDSPAQAESESAPPATETPTIIEATAPAPEPPEITAFQNREEQNQSSNSEEENTAIAETRELQNSATLANSPTTSTSNNSNTLTAKPFTPSNTSFFVPIAGGGAGIPKNNSSDTETGSQSQTSQEETQGNQNQTPPDITPPDPPQITSPSQWHASTTQVTFSGTAEAGSTISTNFSQATTSASAGNTWSLVLENLAQGTTTIQFFAKDTAGNLSTSTERAIFIDSQAPSASLAIDACGNSLSQSSCVVATTTLRISWSSEQAEDFGHYIIACTSENTPCENFTLSQIIATSTVYQAPSGNKMYTFKIKAVDSFGNQGAEAEKTAEIITRPVIINEIAWAGTSAKRHADEYIELYNPTSKSINLSGITLLSLTDGGPTIPLSGTLAPKAFYLIERTDDTTVLDMIASTTAAFGNGLRNDGEVLALMLSDGTIIDKTPTRNDCGGGWCAGNGSTGQYFSMERYDPRESGEDKNNWVSGSGPLSNGKNADGLVINGSPGRRNTGNYLVSPLGTILEKSKTLVKEYSPYWIGSTFTIGEGKTLVIEPGVVIKVWPGSSIAASGILKAEGTSENPIVFTSFQDDEYGGDMNQDGATTTPAAGSWGSIKIYTSESVIDRAIIRYGGHHDDYATTWGNIIVQHASPSIKNSIIEYSGAYGIWLKHASSTIEGNTIRNNLTNTNQDSTGLVVENGKVLITKNAFDKNYNGLRIIGSNGTHEITVSENTFINNTDFPVQIIGAYTKFSKNTARGNGTNGINIQGSPAREGYEFSKDIPYVLIWTSVSIPKGKTLTLPAGTVVKLQNAGLSVEGTIVAQGTSAEKVVFTSLHDDDYGGDTNGTSTQASAGNWRNFSILGQGSASSTLDHVVIRYGGAKSDFDPLGAFRIDTSSPAIKNAVIEKNNRAGVWIKNGTPSFADSIIQDHREPSSPSQSYGMFLSGTSSPALTNVLFKNNRQAIWSGGSASIVNGGGITFEGNDATTTPASLLE